MPLHDDAADVAVPLDRLKASVAEVVRVLEKAGPEYAQTLGLIAATLDALDATAAMLRARAVQGVPLSVWLHELRNPVAAMAGWAQILNNVDLVEQARRRHAREAIERNARLLEQLLASPPS